MTYGEVSKLFPGARIVLRADATAEITGDGWRIAAGDPETLQHTLSRSGAFVARGSLAELVKSTAASKQSEDARSVAETSAAPSPPPIGGGAVSGCSYEEHMSAEDYHAHPSLGSTTVKQALLHPGRIGAPTTISERARFDGHRMHCAVCEPEEMHNRYTVAPKPSDHPFALRTADDMRRALKGAGVKGYSGKKVAELADLCRNEVPGAEMWSDILSDHSRKGAGKQFVSAEEWDEMHRVADAVMDHPVIKSEGIFAQGVGESSFFAPVDFDTPGLFGQQFNLKCRPDWLQHDRVTDLKTWKGGKPLDAFLRQADALHYDLSAAHYLRVLEEHGRNPDDRFTWVVIDKSTMTGGHVVIHVATLSPEFLARGREKLEHALERIAAWNNAPELFEQSNQIEHIAAPPAWDWRTRL